MKGSTGLGTHAKRMRLARLTAQERVPPGMLLDGAAERAPNALERRGYGLRLAKGRAGGPLEPAHHDGV